MANIQLLDCTLRDGGYVNDWEFGFENLQNIFHRIVDAGVEIIEVGFIDERRPFDKNRSIGPNIECFNEIWENTDKKSTMVVGMIDYGTCSIENLKKIEDSFLDGIRVIFKKHLMNEAMEFCRQVKELGYKVFAQLVSITSYTQEELLEVIQLANDIEPYAISIVDTYGLLYPEDLLHYYKILDENVKENIHIGFHAHNNLQLAFANSMIFANNSSKHGLIVDATLHGMGKSAGNAPIELVAKRLNEVAGKKYNISYLLEAIENNIMDFYKKTPWGYKMFFYLSGKNQCHPNYVSYFKETQNFSVAKIDKLLSEIEPNEKKLLYDKTIAERMYNEYCTKEVNDNVTLELFKEEIKRRQVLIIGPGKNIKLQENWVQQFIKENRPYIIAINYIPDGIDVDCVFVTNIRRYSKLKDRLNTKLDVKIMATTNVETMGKKFEYIINREPLLEKQELINDNSFLMLLKILEKIDVKKVFCAGLDGYSETEDNYLDPKMEYYFIKDVAGQLNRHMRAFIENIRNEMDITFLTYSHYDQKGPAIWS